MRRRFGEDADTSESNGVIGNWKRQEFMTLIQELGDRVQLAMDTIALKETRGIPTFMVHVMDMELLEEFSGHAKGDFRRDCRKVYLEFQNRCGACMIDQYIPDNPLSMEQEGFATGAARSATTGIGRIVRDGMAIDSPEAVVEHMERFALPSLRQKTQALASGVEAKAKEILQGEVDVQGHFGRNILKAPYVFSIPYMDYYEYGYENYFAAYALFPEVLERMFSLQADYATVFNTAVARAVSAGICRG